MNAQAIIIIDHGSKSVTATEEFNFIVNTVKKKYNSPHVYGAHMEISTPSLGDIVRQISNTQIKKILIIPYFLFNGRHILKDIPQMIEELKPQYPSLHFNMAAPIGKEEQMADILLKRIANME
jgi:sirohydrochlorin cobaltochelatase